MKALGVYIYAGGFSLGVREHFEVVGHLEDGPFGVQTVRYNLPEIQVYEEPAMWPLDRFQDLDLLYGNPPCSPWSNARQVERSKQPAGYDHFASWRTDVNVRFTETLFDVLDCLRPKVFVWESTNSTFVRGTELIQEKVDWCVDHGYQVYLVLIDASRLNLPQLRRRFFFFVASRFKLGWDKPNGKPSTVREAWSGRDEVPGKVAGNRGVHVMELVKRYKNVRSCLNRLYTQFYLPSLEDPSMAVKKPPFCLKRVAFDQPSYTVLGAPDIIHPTQDRFLTVKEQQLLCGYPESYEFQGSVAKQYQQVGKAVMPPVAAWLARGIKASLLKNESIVQPKLEILNYSGQKIKPVQQEWTFKQDTTKARLV